jgi:hypothetical protein
MTTPNDIPRDVTPAEARALAERCRMRLLTRWPLTPGESVPLVKSVESLAAQVERYHALSERAKAWFEQRGWPVDARTELYDSILDALAEEAGR